MSNTAQLAELDAICQRIVAAHRRRKFAMQHRLRLINSLNALVRAQCFDGRLEAKQDADELIARARDGDDQHGIGMLVAAVDVTLDLWMSVETDNAREMRRLIRQTPLAEFVAGEVGLGELSAASIVGEAGALHKYATHAKLWKRLGLAVIDGERQRKIAHVALAAKHGYSPSRRSTCWVAVDVAFKRWKPSDKQPGNPLRWEQYSQRKVQYLARGWKAGHAHAAAKRWVEKRIIREMWRHWRRAISGDCAQNAACAASIRTSPEPIAAATATVEDVPCHGL